MLSFYYICCSCILYVIIYFLFISKEVFESQKGVYAGIKEGKIIVDCATLSPERMIEEWQIIKSKGGHFLEAPVSGSIFLNHLQVHIYFII
jgi:3-hydroxyisobutyrate dehydrogenase-like beta-hydroxyacid dehydrogenase